ncbi:MAG: isochorismatase family protein [Actinomycetota bacterium]
MTTLPDRPHTAVLVIDAQRGVVDHAHRAGEVVATIASLVERARASGTPIVWVHHHDDELAVDSDAWQLVDGLDRRDDESRVDKAYGDAFEDTDLDDLLAAAGVGRLVVAGAQTDWCVRSTLHGAIARGYDAVLVADAHTTEDLTEWGAPPPEAVIAHTNLYWGNHTAPGREAGTATAAEVALDR